MKKLIACILLVCTVFGLCSCSLLNNPVGEEYADVSYISLENKVIDIVTGVNITAYFDGKQYDSQGMTSSDGEVFNGGTVTLFVHKDEEIKDKDLKKFSIKVTVTEKNGSTVDVDAIAFPLELGKDYQFELTYQNGTYLVRRLDSIVGEKAKKLFKTQNPYVGDMSANSNIADILGIRDEFGKGENALQTSTEPYGWKRTVENTVLNEDEAIAKMRAFSCVMLASVKNLGYVEWEFNTADGANIYRFDENQATEYVGKDIKAWFDSEENVQKLLNAVGII